MKMMQRLRKLFAFVLGPHTACRFIASLLLLALIVIGLPVLSGAQQTCQPNGDVDRNGSVTAADALLAFQQALSLVQLDTCQLSSADVFPQPATPDDNITASDALCIFQKALSLPSCLDNVPPIAYAGADKSVTENTLVTLSGSGSDSDGTIVSYTWSQVSGTLVDISGANSARAMFQAPEVSADTTLEFQLQVEDDDGITTTDRVSVIVMDLVAPDAIAGIDQTVREGTVVTLDGSASRDSDGTIVSYTWSQVSGTLVDISGANSARAMFQAPGVSVDTTLVFQLQVEDDDGITTTDRVSVTIVNISVVELTVSIFGEGTVQTAGQYSLECDVPHLCHAIVPEGANVVLEALPMSGYAIHRWTGCDSASNDTCAVATNRDRLVSVYFLSTEPVQLKDDVVVFDVDRVDEIEDFDIDSGLLVMRADADISDLLIDDVIVSSVIDPDREFTTYFLRRIRDIQKLPGGTGYIRTVQATLEDVIASGSLSSGSTPLRASDVTSYELPDGVTWIELGPGGGALGPPGALSPRLPDAEVSGSAEGSASVSVDRCFKAGLCVKGTVVLALAADFNLDFGITGVKQFKAQVSLMPSAKASIVADDDSGGGTFTHDLPLKFQFAPIALGPVVLVPEVAAQLRFTFTLSEGGDLEPNVTVALRVTGGAHYRRGSGWVPIKEYEPTFEAALTNKEYMGIRSSAEAFFVAKFATKLYKIAGPSVSVGPYVNVAAFTLDPPQGGCNWDWNWNYGARAEFGAEVKILKVGLEYHVTLFDIKFAGPKPGQECDDGSPPTVPSGLTFADVSEQGLTLTWAPSMDDSGVVNYKVLRRALPSTIARAFSGVADAALVDTGLRANRQYCYQVIAIDGAGHESEPSASACARTVSRDMDMAGTPSRVRLDPLSPSVISVSWSLPAGAAVERYVVYEWPQSGASPVAILETEDLSAKVTGLNPGTEYCFGVAAVKKGGIFSEISGMVCAMTPGADAAPWRLFIACIGQDYIFEEPFDLDEESAVSVISVTGAGNDYIGTPLTYAITGSYASQGMILDGRIDWSAPGGIRRVDEFTADLSTDDTGDVLMDLVLHPGGRVCNAVIRFIMEGDIQGSMAGAAVQLLSVGSLSGATISGQ